MGVSLLVLSDRLEGCRARLEADPLDVGALSELCREARPGAAAERALGSLNEVVSLLDSPPTKSGGRTPVKPLSKGEHEGLVVHPREKQERRHKLASLLGRVLHLVQGDQVARTVTRVTEPAGEATYPELTNVNKACANFLGIPPPKVYIARGEEPLFTAMLDREAFVCAHHDYVSDSARGLTDGELRFAVAHQQEHIKNGHAALLQINPERLEGLMLDQAPFLFRMPIQLASKAVGLSRANLAARKIGDWLPDNSRTAKVFETVGDILPDKDQETILPEMVHDWVRSWIQGVEYSGDRAGLLACGSISSSASTIIALSPELSAARVKAGTLRKLIAESADEDRAAADRLRELLRFAFSREYLGYVASSP